MIVSRRARVAPRVFVAIFVAVLGMFASSVVGFGAPAFASGQCVTPQGVYANGTPWAQNLIDAQRIWPLANGAGVTVAVIGTGVDTGNPQFAPANMDPAITMTAGVGGSADCAGYGTFAAGIVAAQPNSATTFAGIAPGARILPIRYTDSGVNADQSPDPGALATAIGAAVSAGAGVILVAVPTTSDSPALDAAVRAATAAGDLVVSAAIGSDSDSAATSYPAADAGALGVGAVNSSGGAVQSESGAYIAVAGPGASLVSTSANSGGAVGQVWSLADPAFASAAYVAGVVALMRSYGPDAALTPAQLITRLALTASRAQSGGQDPYLGWGVVNAYAAVTSELPADAAGPGAAAAAGAGGKTVLGAGPDRGNGPAYRQAGWYALLGLVVAGLVVVTALTVRRGRARGWKLGRVS